MQPLTLLFRRTSSKRWIGTLALGLLFAWGVFSTVTIRVMAAPMNQATATPTAPNHLVISELRTRGPAGPSDEFIELFNPTILPIDISGWSVKRSSDCDLASTDLVVISPATVLLPGQHYLIANAVAVTSPTPDVTYLDIPANRLSDTGGVAIFDSTSLIVDAVGLCDTTLYLEGSPIEPTISSGTQNKSYERLPGDAYGGCYDTDDNKSDFQIIDSSNPQNFAMISVPCDVSLLYTPTFTKTPTVTKTSTFTKTPTLAIPPKIIINEVAWSGTNASISDEWIELYNPGPLDVNLSGWTLENPATGLAFSLDSKILPVDGYYLLERTDDNTVKNITADQIYRGDFDLANTGDSLRLYNPFHSVADTANQDGGNWPAGKSKPIKCSMERNKASAPDNVNGWFTNSNASPPDSGLDADGNLICGTPKNRNWAYDVKATRTPTVTKTRTPTITRTPEATRKPTATRTRTPAPLIISAVVINEFLTLPHSDWNGDGKVDSGDAFIELKNLSVLPVSVTNWRLDDQEGDSSPYYLPDKTIQPGGRMVYFASDTKLVLSNSGDSVRLFKSDGRASDVYTYTVTQIADQTWCRLPDGGEDAWRFGCEPTPNESNRLATTIFVAGEVLPPMCLSKTILPEVYLAECIPSGLELWSPSYWSSGYPLYIQRNEQLDIIE